MHPGKKEIARKQRSQVNADCRDARQAQKQTVQALLDVEDNMGKNRTGNHH